MRKAEIILTLLILCISFSAHGKHLGKDVTNQSVVPIRWEQFDGKPLCGPLEDQIRQMLLLTNKYALNTWYDQIRQFGTQQGEYLDFGGIREHQIRPVASEAFALAVSLQLGVYDEAVTGVPREQAVGKTLKMIASLAARHRANAADKGWGHEWQSALWAGFTATAGWMMWQQMKPHDQESLRRMTLSEADRLIGYNVPYYMDREGRIIFKGDSKAEENAWNSTILMTATAMMPNHPHWQAWYDKAVELQLSAYAAPQDTRDCKKINGRRLCDLLQGSNTDSVGMVVNHNILHPDYMTAFMHNGTNVWIYGLAGLKMPRASVCNGERIYRTLTEYPVKENRTMYVCDSQGKATCGIYYPEGNDWGNNRQACFLMMDVMAMAFDWDRSLKVKADRWAEAHAAEMMRMFARDTTGQYYQQPQEDLYPSREEWVAYHAGFCYLGLWMKAHRLHHFTNGKVK